MIWLLGKELHTFAVALTAVRTAEISTRPWKPLPCVASMRCLRSMHGFTPPCFLTHPRLQDGHGCPDWSLLIDVALSIECNVKTGSHMITRLSAPFALPHPVPLDPSAPHSQCKVNARKMTTHRRDFTVYRWLLATLIVAHRLAHFQRRCLPLLQFSRWSGGVLPLIKLHPVLGR